jgi:hypothetical protein
MTTNFYFNNFQSSQEQTLIEDLIIESIKIYGHDLLYIKRDITSLDELMNEDDVPEYREAFQTEMYIKNVDGFEGEGDFLSKFGLQIRDSITFTTSIRIWEQNVGYDIEKVRPQEGDLIFFPLNGKMFEIQHVEHEAIFYQMGSLQTYDLRCELFEYSNETFRTGYPDVDNLFAAYDSREFVNVDLNAEELAAAEAETQPIETYDPLADNTKIEEFADDIIDFSESNPFGEDNY